MEASGARAELADAFLTAELEVCLGAVERPCDGRKQTKVLSGGGEEAGFFEHRQRERNDGDVGDRDLTEDSDALDIGDLGPQILNGIVEIPRVGEGGTIAF